MSLRVRGKATAVSGKSRRPHSQCRRVDGCKGWLRKGAARERLGTSANPSPDPPDSGGEHLPCQSPLEAGSRPKEGSGGALENPASSCEPPGFSADGSGSGSILFSPMQRIPRPVADASGGTTVPTLFGPTRVRFCSARSVLPHRRSHRSPFGVPGPDGEEAPLPAFPPVLEPRVPPSAVPAWGDGKTAMLPNLPVTIGPWQCGPGCPPLVIAGPCVMESEQETLAIAGRLAEIAAKLPVRLVFKASFDKANRTSGAAFRGLGEDEGLTILSRVRERTGLPVTTDVHLPSQAAAAGSVCDLIQIPAFLCRQTDLLLAAAETGRPVNVKKGQFAAPADMRHVVAKLLAGGCRDILLCERGTFFGYGRLVNDFTGLPTMRSFGVPVIFDATHSVQQPASLGGATGGDRTLVEPLARAAAAVGVDGYFFETHPEPSRSPSDGPNMVPLDDFAGVLERVVRIDEARRTALKEGDRP